MDIEEIRKIAKGMGVGTEEMGKADLVHAIGEQAGES
jgi:hypothetical protein